MRRGRDTTDCTVVHSALEPNLPPGAQMTLLAPKAVIASCPSPLKSFLLCPVPWRLKIQLRPRLLTLSWHRSASLPSHCCLCTTQCLQCAFLRWNVHSVTYSGGYLWLKEQFSVFVLHPLLAHILYNVDPTSKTKSS